jgi:hypothetical protein
MKKTKLYNNLSQELLEELKLKKGEKAVFRLLDIKKDPNNKGKFLIPQYRNITSTDRVWDKYAIKIEEEVDGKKKIRYEGDWVDIAAIKRVGPNETVDLIEIAFLKSNNGLIELSGDRAEDQDMYTFMMLSNRRSENEHRDPSFELVYEKVDNKKKAEAQRRQRNAVIEAGKFASRMEDDDLIDFAASMGWDETRDIAEVRDDVEQFAIDNPKEFMDAVNNKMTQYKALVKRAVSKGVVLFDRQQSKFSWAGTGETICTVPRIAGADHLSGFADFIVTSKRGDVIIQELKRQLGLQKK